MSSVAPQRTPSGRNSTAIRATNDESYRGDKARIGQGTDGRLLIIADPGGPAGAGQQHRNDAVGASAAPVHHTNITIDDQHVSFQQIAAS